MDTLLILAVIAGAILLAVVASRSSQRRALERRTAADLEVVRVVADEDVTRFGEELQRLDTDMLVTPLDEPMRQDYQRALDSYEQAKETLRTARQADDIKHVTQALEDGRYAVACVLARKDGRPLPVRRPPCFFNPRTARRPPTSSGHRPRASPARCRSARPTPTGSPRVPSRTSAPCARATGRVPYWQAGPAYSPWASGYFGAYAASNLLPSFLLLTLLSPTWDGGAVEGADTDFGAGEAGGGEGADAGGDSERTRAAATPERTRAAYRGVTPVGTTPAAEATSAAAGAGTSAAGTSAGSSPRSGAGDAPPRPPSRSWTGTP